MQREIDETQHALQAARSQAQSADDARRAAEEQAATAVRDLDAMRKRLTRLEVHEQESSEALVAAQEEHAARERELEADKTRSEQHCQLLLGRMAKEEAKADEAAAALVSRWLRQFGIVCPYFLTILVA